MAQDICRFNAFAVQVCVGVIQYLFNFLINPISQIFILRKQWIVFIDFIECQSHLILFDNYKFAYVSNY